MAGTLKRLAGPAYIANAAADIFNASSALIYSVIKHIRVSNHTGAAATCQLYLGATGGSAGGTEIEGLSKSVPANDHIDIFFSPGLKMVSTEFLSGLASAASTLTIVVMGEQVVV